MNYKNIKFQYYPSNVKIPKPLGKCTLEYFLKAHMSPSEKILTAIRTIREISGKKELTPPQKKLKDHLKKQLFYFTPSVITDGKGRSYHNIVKFTGIMVMEFDKIKHVEEFKQFVFDRLNSCICAYVSPSGKGVKTLIKIPVCKDIEEYKSYFYGIAYYFEKYKGFDPSNQNPILPLFISYDKDILIRKNPTTWTTKGDKIHKMKVGETNSGLITYPKHKDRNFIKNILKKQLKKVEEEQAGHYNIRSASLLAGGYVAAGYFDFDEMQDFMYEEMENIDYLHKDMKGYKRTCTQMINKGLEGPLYLRDEKNT